MAKYRKKPLVVEAVQWRGDNWQEMADHTGNNVIYDITVPIGDWIIKGVDGRFYSVPNEVFAQTYDVMQSKDPMSTVLVT